MREPLITNDAIILGVLLVLLTLIFRTARSSRPFWQRLYAYVPSLLLCYILPATMNSLGVISGETTRFYSPK